jgi:hypothetical protein
MIDRSALLALTLAAVLCEGGCYRYTTSFRTATGPATDPESVVMWNFLWGVCDSHVEPGNCPSNATYSVAVKHNLWEELVTIITLGIASPATVEWQCAKFPPTPM